MAGQGEEEASHEKLDALYDSVEVFVEGLRQIADQLCPEFNASNQERIVSKV